MKNFMKYNSDEGIDIMNRKFKDCYIGYDGGLLTIGNSKIVRKIKFAGNIPVNVSLSSGYKVWQGGDVALFNIADFNYSEAEVTFETYVDTFSNHSDEALFAEINYKTSATEIKQIFYIFPEVSAVSSMLYIKGEISQKKAVLNDNNTAIEKDAEKSTDKIIFPEFNVVDSVGINGTHFNLKAVKLMDETDVYNELVTTYDVSVYGRVNEYYDGSIFMLNEYIEDKSLMIVSEGYVSGKKFYGVKDLAVNQGCVSVFGNGRIEPADDFVYAGGATLVFTTENELKREYKRFYSCVYNDNGTYIMSNTWGDRNKDTAVKEDFIKQELDVGHRLGIDILQIDDGWQKGITANSGFASVSAKNKAWGDFYDTDPDFWEVNIEKFPGGFEVIKEYAGEKGIKLGLWFSMDKNNSYERWEKDAENILNLYRKYGATYFKIDGLIISDHKCEENIYNFVRYLEKESDGEINFNFDITANRRFGYFMHKWYSTLFVENRYTDWQNYYPHSTLRNLWSLSDYIPTHKMQFEVLNQLRNDSQYGSSPLRPSMYSIDYIFASVMVSNPLIWMEMSHLDEEQKDRLSSIISVYKSVRDDFVGANVTPIGERPDGTKHTGFKIENGEIEYLILLKEQSDAKEYIYNTEIPGYEILATNCADCTLEVHDKKLKVMNMTKSGYIFLKIVKG